MTDDRGNDSVVRHHGRNRIMNQQVITVAPDGTMSGLQRKRGRGVDLRKFGHATIERASEIAWNEDQQAWTVHVLNRAAVRWMTHTMGREHLGATLTGDNWYYAMYELSPRPPKGSVKLPEGWLAFEDYDDAVAAEVAFLDALRLRGIFSIRLRAVF